MSTVLVANRGEIAVRIVDAVHLANSLRREMSIEIAIRDVFGHPTVRRLSDHVADRVGTDIDEGEI